MPDLAKSIVVAIVSALITAAAGWYLARPNPAVLAYAVSSATTGGDSTTRAVVPNLTLRLGDEVIPAITVHTITLSPQGAYAADASVGITFPDKVRIFGVQTETPSALHTVRCEQLDRGVRCSLTPSDPRHKLPFRIAVATDQVAAPAVITTHTNVELQPIETALGQRFDWRLYVAGSAGAFGIFALVTSMLLSRVKAEAAAAHRSASLLTLQESLAKLQMKYGKEAVDAVRESYKRDLS